LRVNRSIGIHFFASPVPGFCPLASAVIYGLRRVCLCFSQPSASDRALSSCWLEMETSITPRSLVVHAFHACLLSQVFPLISALARHRALLEIRAIISIAPAVFARLFNDELSSNAEWKRIWAFTICLHRWADGEMCCPSTTGKP
jgi:hypothetical protein